MPLYDHPYTAAAITAGAVSTAFAAYKLYQLQKPNLPKEWKKVGILQDLYAYPIKSCAPVVLERAECSLLGIKDGWLRDRVLMIIDEKNNFITARAYPELLTILPSVKSSILTLKHVDMEDLCVNLAEVIESGKAPISATVWSVKVPVFDCGLQASEWLTKLLNRPTKFRLAYYASYASRSLRSKNIANKFYNLTEKDTGALPDELSYNLINEASIEDLNTRLSNCNVTHRNFRPNFVIKGATPLDEDNWKYVKIGDTIFEVIKPCTRCILTTIDPETGVRQSKSEPLETLKTYRHIEDPAERKAAGNSPRMGLQMALRSAPGNVITLNDPVYVA